MSNAKDPGSKNIRGGNHSAWEKRLFGVKSKALEAKKAAKQANLDLARQTAKREKEKPADSFKKALRAHGGVGNF